MYCPNCGAGSIVALRYCKHCGESLISTNPLTEPPPRVVRTTGAAWAVAMATVAITLAGLGIVFTTAYEIVHPSNRGNLPPASPDSYIPVAIVMIVFGSATIFGIIFLLIKLFMKLMHLSDDAPRAKKKAPVVQDFRQQPYLQAPPQHMPSVTEHTTRNFELRSDQRTRGAQE